MAGTSKSTTFLPEVVKEAMRNGYEPEGAAFHYQTDPSGWDDPSQPSLTPMIDRTNPNQENVTEPPQLLAEPK